MFHVLLQNCNSVVMVNKLACIIRNTNANANDSHVDYRIHYGVGGYNIWGNDGLSAVLTGRGTGIIACE